MKFKKLLSALAVSSAFMAGAASATPFVVNVAAFGESGLGSAAGAGVGDGKTILIDALGLNWNATSVYTDSNNNGIVDAGEMVTDSGSGSVGYRDADNETIDGFNTSEGIGGFYKLYFSYANLIGQVVGIDPLNPGRIGAIYGSGVIDIFADLDPDAAGLDPLIMSLGVTGSDGGLGNFTLFANVTYAMPGVFLLNGTQDFSDVIAINVIGSETNFNNDGPVPVAGLPGTLVRTSELNGRLVFTNAVPEPGALALLGLGLLGMGAVRRYKKVV